MPSSPLPSGERRRLRTLGQGIRPTLRVGHEGVTPQVLRALEDELRAHELVKVRVLSTGEADAKAVSLQLAASSLAQVVQVIGHTVLLYRPCPEGEE